MLCETPHPSRRAFLTGMGTMMAWAHAPRFARAAAGNRDPRLLVVILRGAMDGLAAVPPLGDPDYAGLAGDLAVSASGPRAALPLDSFFALNPALGTLHRLHKAGQALTVHAAATPYRERSHFDGQDVLENGTTSPNGARTGWLNRAVAALPSGERVGRGGGLAVGERVALVLRGPAPVLSWAPPRLPAATAPAVERLKMLYAHTDPELAQLFQAGLDADASAKRGQQMAGATPSAGAPQSGLAKAFAQIASGAAQLMMDEEGPRIAALAFDGWDTHFREGSNDGGQLMNQLTALDAAVAAFEAGFGRSWRDTVILVVTEFGRTARINGTEGTDHGTGTAAFLIGGAVKGGRVVADWPTLKLDALHEGRDLKPTIDLRAVFKGVLRDHLGLSERVLAADVFPGSLGVKPMDGLVAA